MKGLTLDGKKRTRCDIVKNAETNGAEGGCAKDEVCLRSGVFFKQTRLASPGGYCVQSARPLLPLGSFCVADMDCASGLCDLLQFAPKIAGEKNVEVAMGGTCQLPCTPEVWATEVHDDC